MVMTAYYDHTVARDCGHQDAVDVMKADQLSVGGGHHDHMKTQLVLADAA